MNTTDQRPEVPYIGRFAPSPTGRLHFGSLIAAVASFAQARAQNGRWLVRMEDLDPPRERVGAAEAIVADLKRFGMPSDDEVLYQSTRHDAYQDALRLLDDQGDLFPCACARKQLRGHNIYPNTCSDGLAPGAKPRTLRVRVAGTVGFDDLIQGPFAQDLERDVGAFIVRRADQLTAYQLAVVVDDAFQEITEVVRGADLLDSTPRQIFLQRLLGLPVPHYAHVPVAINEQGSKLSKQTGARAIDPQAPLPELLRAWRFLGQTHPPASARSSVDRFWDWAVSAWSMATVPTVTEKPAKP